MDHHCTYGDSRHPHNKVGCLGSLEDSIKRNEGLFSYSALELKLNLQCQNFQIHNDIFS